MARVIDKAPWNGPGQRRRYPWDQWLDGQVWELRRGEDFQSTARVFQAQVSIRCARKGLAYRTTVAEDGDVVYVQALGPRVSR